ncbi:alpha/beta hydrolase [Oxalobacteraceae bacterium CAVE-383]|nr:alpha/beta hydrolase [Oxalobacteraceae bacterium CAVE-383]
MAMLILLGNAYAETPQQVVDLQTRSGVTQRMVVLAPPEPKATVILFSGGDGGLNIQPDGTLKRGKGNFLVRTRQLFADQGFLVAVVDTPSDRQDFPYLQGFRQTSEHVTDIKAVIAWARSQAKVPVWLVGTSRGTQSAAYVATELSSGADGPDGLVLTSTILTDKKDRPVPSMPLDRLHIPVIVAHHKDDGCKFCAYSRVPAMMDKLTNATRKQLLTFSGGESKDDPCESYSYHGYNGIEADVVSQVSAAILQK